MPRGLYIPRQVRDSIIAHIQTATDRAVGGFLSANEDEDTVTGALGSSLRSGLQVINVTNDEINGPWKWSIDYRKFRGRGPNATEFFLGADGIFELTLDYGGRKDAKSLLFQSKTEWARDTALLPQAARLSTWREAAIFINYTPSAFYAYSIDGVLGSRGVEAHAKNRLLLQDALTRHFLNCRIGNMDLRYDPLARRLIWRDFSGAVVAVQFSIPNRIRVKIQSPNADEKVDYEKLLRVDEIHRHRMQAEPEEILMPLLSETPDTVKNRKRALSGIYHPDKYPGGDQLMHDLMNARLQEINAAQNAFDAIHRGNESEPE